jgi:hypothetical protein
MAKLFKTIMKNTYLMSGLALSALLLLIPGCGKPETPADKSAGNPIPPAKPVQAQPAQPPQPTEVKKAATTTLPTEPAKPAPPTTPTVTQTPAAPATPPAAPPPAPAPVIQPAALVQTASNQIHAVATAITNQALSALGVTNLSASALTNNYQVQALLDRAKALTANQNYQEALAVVSQIYQNKLTPDQKQKVDDLKNQIQTAIAQKATGSALDILGGRK